MVVFGIATFSMRGDLMHLEILVEDRSGKTALDILVPKIIGTDHTFRVIPYRGIGHIPPNLKPKSDPKKRILLDQLPRLLQGYGKTFADYPSNFRSMVVVVCDLDSKCLSEFRRQLLAVVNACEPRPTTQLCIAIEEGEAWLLGDLDAVKSAFPNANDTALNSYINDSICGTWEKMADALYPGGSLALSKKGWPAIGAEKSKWAQKIAPSMDIETNRSPSFRYFVAQLRRALAYSS